MKFILTGNSKTLYLNGKLLKRKWTKCTRRVYLGEKFVVKIDKTKFINYGNEKYWNQRQSYAEYLTFLNVKKYHLKYFIPIVKYGIYKTYFYVIQPKVKIFNFQEFNKIIFKYKDQYTKFIDVMEKYGVCDTGWEGNETWNSELKCWQILDYGSNLNFNSLENIRKHL